MMTNIRLKARRGQDLRNVVGPLMNEAVDVMDAIRYARGQLTRALRNLCGAWDGANDGGEHRGNVTNATTEAREILKRFGRDA